MRFKVKVFVIVLILIISTHSITLAARILLKQGERGRIAGEIQAMLTTLKFYHGDIDGVLNQGTMQALHTFQQRMRLRSSAGIDKNTYQILAHKSGLRFKKAKKTLYMQATAYTRHDDGVGVCCRNGMKLKRGVVAVDPRVIPLNTWLYIHGYGYAIAADVGGAIKNKIIDVCFHSIREATQWGRREVLVEIY